MSWQTGIDMDMRTQFNNTGKMNDIQDTNSRPINQYVFRLQYMTTSWYLHTLQDISSVRILDRSRQHNRIFKRYRLGSWPCPQPGLSIRTEKRATDAAFLLLDSISRRRGRCKASSFSKQSRMPNALGRLTPFWTTLRMQWTEVRLLIMVLHPQQPTYLATTTIWFPCLWS